MGSFLTESVPVSLSGSLGDVGGFKLFACDQPNVVLYVAKQPTLMLDRLGKPGVAVTTYTVQQPDGSVKIVSGATTLSVNTAPQLDQASIDEARARVTALGVGDPAKLRFLPLTTQKGKALLHLPVTAGEADKAHNERDVGTPGGSLSFLANLTEIGALEWSQAIKSRGRINGDITIQYEYLRRVPDVGAEVRVHGERIFEHLSAALDVSYNGFIYGGSAKLEAAWDALSRNGGIEVVFLGQGLPPDLEKYRQEMVATFTKQAMQILFDQIFAPMPEVAPAQAAHGGGAYGGANFALKWQKKTDAIDMTQRIEFRGTTWLTDTMDISLAALLSEVDPSCLTEVPAQQAFDSMVVVDSDPMLSNASVSLNWSAGRSPVAAVFGKDGGQERYTVVSTQPGNIVVNAITKINYSPPRWPVTTYSEAKTVANGGNLTVIKTAAAVGRQMIFMFVREGNRIIPPSELTPDDYLILNVSYAGPHLPAPVRDSAHIDASTPIDFAYPMDMAGRPGVAKFSAFGIIGGELKRSAEQIIPQDDAAVFILATRGGDIQLVTSQSMLGESDNLAQDLIRGKGRPLVAATTAPAGAIPEATRTPGYGPRDGDGKVLSGRTVGVEYGAQGASLWIQIPDGTSRRVRLRSSEDSSHFEKDSKEVKIYLEPNGEYAESIFLALPV
jgi:hypothetical protein